MYSILKTLFSVAVVFILWECFVSAFALPPYIVPSIYDVATAFIRCGPSLLSDTAITLGEAVAGLFVSCILSFFLWLFIITFPKSKVYFVSFSVVIKSVPVVIFAPIFLIWFGYGISGKIMLSAIMTFFPLVIALLSGMNTITKNEYELFRVYNASSWMTFKKLIFPRCVPSITAGLKISAPMATMGALIAETAGAKNGLGVTMMIASANFNTGLLFAAAIIGAALGLGLYGGVVCIERCLIKYIPR